MKHDIHPPYGAVVFRDRSTGSLTLTRSTLVSQDSDKVVELDGRTYPVIDVDITSDSHPFWTGTARALDTEGRVEKFQRRYGRPS
ncbi:type B 50S ribosomal protein L31 [Nocardioides lijunqiniae]|uniref:type B 50S ribosomal protein L31 n=1 Tax=Nocardioides lijunqiniae TaxID=2760832 RepID=UPI001877D6D4|nr:type B 50S ribosomal protein L31 [Nocardioides lijunqiniae]